jgi:hypothetical protein
MHGIVSWTESADKRTTDTLPPSSSMAREIEPSVIDRTNQSGDRRIMA